MFLLRMTLLYTTSIVPCQTKVSRLKPARRGWKLREVTNFKLLCLEIFSVIPWLIYPTDSVQRETCNILSYMKCINIILLFEVGQCFTQVRMDCETPDACHKNKISIMSHALTRFLQATPKLVDFALIRLKLNNSNWLTSLQLLKRELILYKCSGES
jgi:hypothetical protein